MSCSGREGGSGVAERRFDGGDRSVIDLRFCVRCSVEVYRRLFGLLYASCGPVRGSARRGGDRPANGH